MKLNNRDKKKASDLNELNIKFFEFIGQRHVPGNVKLRNLSSVLLGDKSRDFNRLLLGEGFETFSPMRQCPLAVNFVEV